MNATVGGLNSSPRKAQALRTSSGVFPRRRSVVLPGRDRCRSERASTWKRQAPIGNGTRPKESSDAYQGGAVKTSRTVLGRRAGQGIVALVIAVLLWGDQAGAAAAPRERHCVHPLGFDMNEVSNTDHRIITDFCTVALVGERWIPAAAWTTNTTYEVIPEGYTPSRATPIDDFSAKFVSAGYVIDAGTNHQRTYTFSASKILQLVTAPGRDFPTASIMAVLPPLPPGAHTVDIFHPQR
jgi:hypothetical protein